MHDTEATAVRAAGLLGAEPDQVLVCSTGVIGERIDMPVLLEGVDVAALALADTPQAGTDAATAIMTTDTVSKEDALTVGAGEQSWTIGGMIKGVGMLAPGLATMLAVITTDAVLTPQQAQDALASATMRTVNRINSDGCMSTNDTVLLMASGASGESPDLALFKEKLLEACQDLSLQLLGDAEGAHHDVEIKVTKAASVEGALFAARTIARSNLVKTAIYGNDPNWGRILSQLGTVPEDILPCDPGQVNVDMNGVKVCENGGIGEEPYLADLKPRECHILVELNAGDQEAFIWTSDLTHEYVHINGDYTT